MDDHRVSLSGTLRATGLDAAAHTAPAARSNTADQPRHVGQYALTGVLGSGGMGVVYRAEQQRPLRRTVALKLIRRGLDTDRVIARFEAERLALARMNHSGIARVFDAGSTDDGRPYVVMELVEGQPITAFCDAAGAGIRERLTLFVAACRAVQHAHQKGIVHRDLKPSNILVTVEEGAPAPKVIDFGIAKVVADEGEDGHTLTHDGGFVGTPDYMSPEQAGVVLGDVDTRTDVYALGVVLYELLAGRKPRVFESTTRDEIQRVLRDHAAVRPSTAVEGGPGPRWRRAPEPDSTTWAQVATARRTTPERLRRTLAGDLDTIVLKAMAFEPGRRYASVDQFAEDIERYLKGQPVLARPDAWAYRTGKFVRRHRLAVGGVALVALALVGVSVLTTRQAARAAQERDRAEAVNRFLVEMFEQVSPSRALGERLSAVQVIERGTATLRSELQDQPEVKAALLLTLADVHENLGRFPEARDLAAEAVALREGLGDDLASADALIQYGDAARRAEDLPRAEPAIRRGLAIRRARLGDEAPEVAHALHNLALLVHDQGRSSEAEAMFREAIRIYRAAGAPALEVALSLSGLGTTLRGASRYQEAETVLRETLALRQSVLPADHPRLLQSMRQLAQVLNYVNRNEEAEVLFRDVLMRADRVLGPDHPDTEGVVNDLASLLHDRGRLDDAERLYARALAAGRSRPPSLGLALQLNNIATLYEDQGRFAEAVPLYRESLDLRTRLRGPGHSSVATAMNNLGRLTATLGDLAEGERLLRSALTIRFASDGADHLLTARTRYNLGRVLRMRGEHAGARRELDAALAIQLATLAATHPHVLHTRLERARTSIAQRAWADAEADARTVLEARRAAPDVQPWERAEAQLVLALSLAPARADEARALVDAARPVLAASGPARVSLAREADRATALLRTRRPS